MVCNYGRENVVICDDDAKLPLKNVKKFKEKKFNNHIRLEIEKIKKLRALEYPSTPLLYLQFPIPLKVDQERGDYL